MDMPQSLALEQNSNHNRQGSQHHHDADNELELFGNQRNPFVFMQNMMNNMGQMMSQMETRINSDDYGGAERGQGMSFSSSTVMSMDKRNGGQPRIIQATSEKLRGPEGLERTRKAVRDTGRNLEKMEVVHRLGERGHRIVKERDPSTGHLLENREFDHIEDENAFEHEWFDRAGRYGLKNPNGNGFSGHANNFLQSPSSYNHSQEPRQLAIESGSGNSGNSRSQKDRRSNRK